MPEEEIKVLEENAKVAAYYVEDAIEGRLANGKAVMYTRSGSEPWVYRAFNFHVSDGWSRAVVAANLAHSMLVVLEPEYNSRRGPLLSDTGEPSMLLLCVLVELLALSVYIVDVGLKMYYQKPAVYVTKTWQVCYMSLVAVLTLDVALPLPSMAWRWTRPLRPVVLLVRVRSVRRFYTVVIEMLPNLLSVVVPILFLLLLSSVVLGRMLGNGVEELHDFGSALFHFFILLATLDNYNVVLDGAIEFHPFASIFVFGFIIIGVLFLVSLVLGVTVDAYTEHTRSQIKSERKKLIRGLAKSFATMDTEKKGWITHRQWRALLTHLKPKQADVGESLELYRMLSGSRDNRLDAINYLSLEDVLECERAVPDGAEKRYLPPVSSWTEACKTARNHWLWLPLTRALITLDTVVLCMRLEDSWSVLGVPLNAILLLLFAAEQAVKVGCVGTVLAYWHFASALHRADLAILLACIASSCVVTVLPLLQSLLVPGLGAPLPVGLEPDPLALAADGGALLAQLVLLRLVCNGLRVLRATLTSNILCTFAFAVAGILPLLWQTAGFAFVIMYFFAVLGLETMGGDVTMFSAVSTAFLTLIQLMFSVAISDVMLEAMQENDLLPEAYIIFYFVAYFCLGVMILINLVTALTIEFYNRQFLSEEEANSDHTPPHPDVLMEVERVKVDSRKAASVVMKLMRRSAPAVSSVRDLMATEDTRKVTRKEVEACKKEATVDLLAMFDKKAKDAEEVRKASEAQKKAKKDLEKKKKKEQQEAKDGVVEEKKKDQ